MGFGSDIWHHSWGLIQNWGIRDRFLETKPTHGPFCLFTLELLLMVQVWLWSSWIWEQVLSSSFHGSSEMQKGIISPNMFCFGGWKRLCSLSPLIWVETLTKCSENSDLCINPGLWFAVCPPKPLLDLCGQLGGLPTAWAGIPFPRYRGH